MEGERAMRFRIQRRSLEGWAGFILSSHICRYNKIMRLSLYERSGRFRLKNRFRSFLVYCKNFIYTWFFENRVNESFIFFEVALILRLSLKDTVSKLRSKEVFLFMSAVFLHLLQQLVARKREAKKKNKNKKNKKTKNKCKRKETPKEVGWFLVQNVKPIAKF